MTYTRFKDSYRKQGPAVPGSRVYKRLKPLRTGIERYYGLAKENRYRMETNNTYMGHDIERAQIIPAIFPLSFPEQHLGKINS